MRGCEISENWERYPEAPHGYGHPIESRQSITTRDSLKGLSSLSKVKINKPCRGGFRRGSNTEKETKEPVKAIMKLLDKIEEIQEKIENETDDAKILLFQIELKELLEEMSNKEFFDSFGKFFDEVTD